MRTGEDVRAGASPQDSAGGAVAVDTRQHGGRHGLGRGVVVAIGVVALVVALVVVPGLGSGGDARLPAAATPAPDDELAEVDVVRADGPAGLPDADPGELVAPVHAVSAACRVDLGQVPASSAYHAVTDTVSSADGPTMCRAQPLPDGRLIGSVGWGTDDLRVGVIDPRRPGDGPQPGPAGLGDHFVAGSTELVVGFVEDTGEALVTRRTGGAEGGLVAMDVDTGEQREILTPGAVGDEDSVIAAAHLADGQLMIVTGGATAIGPAVIAGIDQSVREATRIWFGPLDGELEMVREPYPLPDGGEVEPRDLLPPRIVGGADGPLIASFEHLFSDDTWQLVLIAPDGATRVAAELEGRGPLARSTADEPRPGSALLGSGGPGASFDAFGSQMLIAGTVIGDAADDPEGTPTALLLDLDQGTFSRLPVEATSATFVRTQE